MDGKKTALEVQEQYNEFEKYHKSYPNEISLTVGLSPTKKIGIEKLNKDDCEAVSIKITIDSPLYNKDEVKKSIMYAFYKILKAYE